MPFSVAEPDKNCSQSWHHNHHGSINIAFWTDVGVHGSDNISRHAHFDKTHAIGFQRPQSDFEQKLFMDSVAVEIACSKQCATFDIVSIVQTLEILKIAWQLLFTYKLIVESTTIRLDEVNNGLTNGCCRFLLCASLAPFWVLFGCCLSQASDAHGPITYLLCLPQLHWLH